MRNILLAFVLAFSFTSCGKEDKRKTDCSVYGDDCHTDGKPTPSPEPGPQGPSGKNGTNGKNGTSCVSEQFADHVTITCGDYDPVVVMNGKDGVKGDKGDTGSQGPQGTAGTNGTNGTNGQDGQSCHVIQLLPSHDNPTGGAKITCGTDSVIVVNGAAGADAAAYTIVGTVDPCGPSGGQDEVFLRMASGNLVALFVDNGSALTARLSYIRDGVGYKTTDSQACTFSLATNASGVRTITYGFGTPLSESWQTY